MSADWVVIEREFRAGVLSVREIAATQGISHTAINKRARADGWERNLGAKIQAQADAIVARKEAAVAHGKATEREIIESNAEAIARIRMAHRADISEARQYATKLRAELAADADGDTLRTRATTFKALADAMKVLFGLEREAWGLEQTDGAPPKQPGDEIDATDLARRMAFVFASAAHAPPSRTLQ